MTETDLTHLHDQVRRGDADALDALVRAYWPFVVVLAKRFRRTDDDLIQTAAVGLLKALRGFEPSRGLKFTTYARHCILGELTHYLRDHGSVIRIPRRFWEAGVHHVHVGSLTEPLGADGDGSLRTLADLVGYDEPGFGAAEARLLLRPVLQRLRPRHRRALFLYFGLGYSQRDVASIVGLTQKQISRICRRAARLLGGRKLIPHRPIGPGGRSDKPC